ncbi:MAG: hypothetical protein K9M11_02750 [Candidatus Pacebacteria bacterium]|nr:hypothetical protein [Candidatus Paceibacterota bacterium]
MLKSVLPILKHISSISINGLVELLFPKNTNTPRKHNTAERLLEYREPYSKGYSKKTYAGATYFMEYKNALVKRLLWQFKYFLNPIALRCYTYILYDELIAEVSDRIINIPFSTPYPLIHCPSSTYFKNEKDFDHMKELILYFEKLQNPSSPFFLTCTHAVLPKVSNSPTSKAQHTGTRKERFEWAEQRFIISDKFEEYLIKQSNRKINLYCIDDVVTTGASLNAISKMFKERFGLNVRTFSLCH